MRLTLLDGLDVKALANLVREAVEALLVLVRDDGIDDAAPPPAGDGLRFRLLFGDEHLEAPARRQIRVEEVFEEGVGENAHAESGEGEEGAVLVVKFGRSGGRRGCIGGGGDGVWVRLGALGKLEEVLDEIRDTAEVAITRLVAEDVLREGLASQRRARSTGDEINARGAPPRPAESRPCSSSRRRPSRRC